MRSKPLYDGPAYVAALDRVRLTGQTKRIFDLMKDQQWRTLEFISMVTKDPAASISAQLRHLRKPRFGGHTLERRRAEHGNGLFEYRIIPNKQKRGQPELF